MAEPSNNAKTSKIAKFAGWCLALSFSIIILITLIMVLLNYFEEKRVFNRPDILEILFIYASVADALLMFIGGIAGFIALIQLSFSKGKHRGVYRSILVIVILLIILTAIPSFLQFDARSRQSEAKQNLWAIYEAYKVYHRKHHTYPISPSIQFGNTTYNCLNITGWEPKGQLRYTYECEGTQAYWPGWDGSGKPSPCSPPIATHATKDSFTIAACGNIDNDTTLDEWTIDDAKHLRNVVDDVKN
jgi:type IV pilus assembly protein PilA